MKKNTSLALVKAALAQFQHRETSTHVVNAAHTLFPSGVEVLHAVKFPKTVSQADKAGMLRDLVNYGFSQKDAAGFLNISQSYASKLLHK